MRYRVNKTQQLQFWKYFFFPYGVLEMYLFSIKHGQENINTTAAS